MAPDPLEELVYWLVIINPEPDSQWLETMVRVVYADRDMPPFSTDIWDRVRRLVDAGRLKLTPGYCVRAAQPSPGAAPCPTPETV